MAYWREDGESMTGAELEIWIRAHDDASAKLKDIDRNVGGLGKTLGDVGKVAAGFAIGYGLLQAPGLLMSAAQAAADEEASILRLKTAVENTGGSWDVYGGQLDAVVEMGMKKGFDDDAQRAALSLLMAQTGDATEGQKRFALAQDVSRGAGVDLEMASRLLGKVTEENVNVFKRMGVNLQAGSTEAEAFAALQQKFGGQADAYAKSTAGQMEAAKIQFGELKEDIGYMVLPVMLKLATVVSEKIIPAVRELVAEWGPKLQEAFKQAKTAIQPVIAAVKELQPHVERFIENGRMLAGQVIARLRSEFNELRPHVETFIKNVRDIAGGIIEWVQSSGLLETAIAGLTTIFEAWKKYMELVWALAKPFFEFLFDHKETVIALAAALGVLLVVLFPIPAAILAIILAIGYLSEHWDAIKAKTLEVWTGISDFLNEKFGFLKGIMEAAWTDMLAKATFAWDSIKNYVETAIAVIRDIINIAMAVLHGDWGLAWDGVKQLVSDVWDGIKTQIEISIDLIKGIFAGFPSLILAALGDLGSLLYDAGKAILQGLWNGMKDKWEDMKEWVADLGGKIKGLKGPIEKDLTLLLPQGKAIIQGLQAGMQSQWPSAERQVGGYTAALAGGGNTYNTQSIGRQGHNLYAPINVYVQNGSDILAELERQLR